MNNESLVISDIIRSTISLFIVMDPIGLVPLLASLTSNLSKVEVKIVIKNTLLTATGLLIVFVFGGQYILRAFGITLESFSIAGGLLLLILSFEILLKGWELKDSKDIIGLSAVPLAFPLLVGPGAITTTLLTVERYGLVTALISVIVALTLTTITFLLLHRLNRFLGKLGSLIISRIIAIFIAAIAIEFIIFGIKNIFFS